jgi:hypothetical protein
MKTVSMKTKAWIGTGSDVSPKDLMEGKKLDQLIFWHLDNFSKMGYTFVGEAELTVTVPDEKTLIDNKVQALREEAKSIRAAATAQVTRIEGQIQSLLAITCDATLVTADADAAGDIESP